MEEPEPDIESLMRAQRRLQRPWAPQLRAPAPPDPVLDEMVGSEFDGEPLRVTMSLTLRGGFTVTTQVYNDQHQLEAMLADGWVETNTED